MDTNRLLGGLVAAAFVLLWGVPNLLRVLLSEPPPTRPRKLKAIGETMTSVLMGYGVYWLTFGWAAGFLNALVEKYTGVNPGVDASVAGVVAAVVVTALGPSLLKRAEKMLGHSDEVTP